MHACSQLKAGVEKVLEVLKEADAEYRPHIIPETVTYMDIVPEMVGYVLGSKGATVKTIKEKTRTQIQITGWLSPFCAGGKRSNQSALAMQGPVRQTALGSLG